MRTGTRGYRKAEPKPVNEQFNPQSPPTFSGWLLQWKSRAVIHLRFLNAAQWSQADVQERADALAACGLADPNTVAVFEYQP